MCVPGMYASVHMQVTECSCAAMQNSAGVEMNEFPPFPVGFPLLLFALY